MNPEKIRVSSQGQGWSEAMELTEKLGAESGLAHKEQLRLRLLAEELVGLMRGIAGDVGANYWVETTGKEFVLHLSSNVLLNQQMHKQLVAVSSTGENAAARGFMGKIREMIAVALLPKDSGLSGISLASLGLMSMGSPGGYRAGSASYDWSMKQYKSEVESSRGEGEKTEEAWDELEKSIVANIADEISVSVVGSHVEIAIFKAF